MKFNTAFAILIAAGALLGSTGLASAGSDNAPNDPFATNREWNDPQGGGTPITGPRPIYVGGTVVAGPTSAAASGMSDVVADDPFAIDREWNDPQDGGAPVLESHIATPEDNAASQIASDPFD